ncbi:hypothetical protein [Streptomyces sp. NPDC005476]|uniref:hypothetical protein n=1 Tax=Streptomyces sp. NPDC005476 TaxID=3156882 RepID=UPI003456F2E7
MADPAHSTARHPAVPSDHSRPAAATNSAATEQHHRKKKISTMNKLIGPLCAVSTPVALAVMPTTAQAAGTEDGAPLVAAENEIIDQLATLGWPGQDPENFYPGALDHADTATGLHGSFQEMQLLLRRPAAQHCAGAWVVAVAIGYVAFIALHGTVHRRPVGHGSRPDGVSPARHRRAGHPRGPTQASAGLDERRLA